MEQQNEMTLIESIRKRPAMYTGSTSVRGFNVLLQEIIKKIFVTTNANYFSFELLGELKGKFIFINLQTKISDNAALNLWKTYEEYESNYELSVLNALSNQFEFKVFDQNNNQLFYQTFEKGELKQGEIKNQEYEADKFEITFDLDDSVFEIAQPLNANFYLGEIRDLAYLHKGKTLALIYPVAGETYKAAFNFENGLKEKFEVEKLKGLGDTFFDSYFEKQFENFAVEAAFGFREYTVDEPFLIS